MDAKDKKIATDLAYEIIKEVSEDQYEVNEELKSKCKIFINNIMNYKSNR